MRIQPISRRQLSQKTQSQRQLSQRSQSQHQLSRRTESQHQLSQSIEQSELESDIIDICAVNVPNDIQLIPGIESTHILYYRAGFGYKFFFEVTGDETPSHSFEPENPYYTAGETAIAHLTINPPKSMNRLQYEAKVYLERRESILN